MRPTSPVILDERPVPRRVGLVVLSTDHTSERDFARHCPPDRVGVYANRVAYANPTTPERLRQLRSGLASAAADILPGDDLDAVCFSCTAASAVIGDEAVAEAIHKAKPDVPVVTPVLATRAAFDALGARRISVLTPYTEETTASVVAYLANRGMEIDVVRCFGMDDDRAMARVAQASIVEAARETMAATSEALFISCTALRAAEVAGTIEAALGRPVVTSNLASLWMMLRHVGCAPRAPGTVKLFAATMPGETA